MENCTQKNKAVPFEVHNTAASLAEKQRAAAFYEALIQEPARFPCSFLLDGTKYQGFGEEFELSGHDTGVVGEKRTDTLWLRHKSGLSVRAECALYANYAAYEWTLYFKNEAAQNSPRISELRAADWVIPGRGARLRGILGDARNEEYGSGDGSLSPTYGMNNQPYDVPLAMGLPYELRSKGGCACNHEFPYFKIQTQTGGAMVAIGWPGQWKASFLAGKEGVRFTAAQEYLDTYLYPQEELRTPLVCFVLFDEDDEDRQTNLWRHFFMDCNMPRQNGKISQPVVCGTSFGNTEVDPNGTDLMVHATEDNQIARIRAYRQQGIHLDYWWMDAGWYTADVEDNPPKVYDDYAFTGTWKVREKDFPTHLKAISDCMAQENGKTLLWFEPERCGLRADTLKNDGSTLKREWLLNHAFTMPRPRAEGVVELPIQFVNLGNPEAYDWLKKQIFKVLEEGNIAVYREDHNIRPLEFWLKTDEPDRIGMTENNYIVAHLKLWDELREHFDDMILDSCASGGRRNDLESMRRAVPLHITDFFIGDLTRRQAVHQALFRWFPYFKAETSLEGRVNDYELRCGLTPWTNLGMDSLNMTPQQQEKIKRYLKEWADVKELFYADYYPLLDWNIDEGQWLAYEFIDPVTQVGFVQAYRRPLCENAEQALVLKGLQAEKTYRITNLTTGEETVACGAQLMRDGAVVRLPEAPAAATLKISVV